MPSLEPVRKETVKSRRKKPDSAKKPNAVTAVVVELDSDDEEPSGRVKTTQPLSNVLPVDVISHEPAGCSVGKKAGRKKKSCVWHFFTYDEAAKLSRCNAPECAHTVADRNTGNAKSHLKTHSELWIKYSAEEAERLKEEEKLRVKASHDSQPKFIDTIKNPYKPGSIQYAKIMRSIAKLVSSTSVSLNTVVHPSFCGLLKTLDSRSPLPGRKSVNGEIISLFETLASQMRKALSTGGMISVTTNIWSKKGLTASFLGITVHFTNDSKKHVNLALACRHFPTPHTAVNVYNLVKSILTEFGIERTQVSAVITDNGSNMICDFKNYVADAKDLADFEKNQEALRRSTLRRTWLAKKHLRLLVTRNM